MGMVVSCRIATAVLRWQYDVGSLLVNTFTFSSYNQIHDCQNNTFEKKALFVVLF